MSKRKMDDGGKWLSEEELKGWMVKLVCEFVTCHNYHTLMPLLSVKKAVTSLESSAMPLCATPAFSMRLFE